MTERGEEEEQAADAAVPDPSGVKAAPEEQLLSLRWRSCSAAASSRAVNRVGLRPAALAGAWSRRACSMAGGCGLAGGLLLRLRPAWRGWEIGRAHV